MKNNGTNSSYTSDATRMMRNNVASDVRRSNLRSTSRGSSHRTASTTSTRHPVPQQTNNPFAELCRQAIDAGIMIPAGKSASILQGLFAPVVNKSTQEVEWCCAFGVACDLGIPGVTCRQGTTKCRNNHVRMCRFELRGTCRFGTSCQYGHYKLWTPLETDSSVEESVEDDVVMEVVTPGVQEPCCSGPSYLDRLRAAPVNVPVVQPVVRTTVQPPAKEFKKNQLCKHDSKEECPFARKGRCNFAHGIAELEPTPEVKLLESALADPVKNKNFLNDIRKELVRVSTDNNVIKFAFKDKADICQHSEIPSPNDFGNLLRWWANLASRTRSMMKGKIKLPTGVSIDDIPNLTLFPELGFENVKEGVVWVLHSRTSFCTDEKCRWSINCRSGGHLPKCETCDDYKKNIIVGRIYTFEYLEGRTEKNSSKVASLENDISILSTRIASLEKKRVELKTERNSANGTVTFSRGIPEIERDLGNNRKELSKAKNQLSTCWLRYDFSEFPQFKNWEDEIVYVDQVLPDMDSFQVLVPTNDIKVIVAKSEATKKITKFLATKCMSKILLKAAKKFQVNIAKKTIVKLITRYLTSKRVLACAKNFHNMYITKLNEYTEKWNLEGIETTYAKDKYGEIVNEETREVYSEIKDKYFDPEDWMNGIPRSLSKKFVGKFSYAYADDTLCQMYNSRYGNNSEVSFKDFITKNSSIYQTVELMRSSKMDYSICHKYIAINAHDHGISVTEYAMNSINFNKYLPYIDFFTSRNISFSDFCMEANSMIDYLKSGTRETFEKFKELIEDGWSVAKQDTNTTTLTPAQVTAQVYKKLSSSPVVEIDGSQYWFVGRGIYVTIPRPSEKKSFEAIKELRMAISSRNVSDISEQLQIVTENYKDGSIIDEASRIIELKTNKKLVIKSTKIKKTKKVDVQETVSNEIDDLTMFQSVDLTALDVKEPFRGSYQGKRDFEKSHYVIVSDDGKYRNFEFGPFQEKSDATTFQKAASGNGINLFVKSADDTKGERFFNVHIRVTKTRGRVTKRSVENISEVCRAFSKACFKIGIASGSVAIQYQKCDEDLFLVDSKNGDILNKDISKLENKKVNKVEVESDSEVESDNDSSDSDSDSESDSDDSEDDVIKFTAKRGQDEMLNKKKLSISRQKMMSTR